MSDEQKTVSEIIKDAIQKTRGSSAYWDWSLDRRLSELAVAKILMNYLAVNNPAYIGNFAVPEKDPPDVLILTKDGRRIGIEVSEIVDERTAAQNRHAKRGDFIAMRHRRWTLHELTSRLRTQVGRKNCLLNNARSNFDEIFLALMTDEFCISLAIANQCAANLAINSKNIDQIYLILSYSPFVDRMEFPDGHPVVRIEKLT